jgi:hypothetical protein
MMKHIGQIKRQVILVTRDLIAEVGKKDAQEKIGELLKRNPTKKMSAEVVKIDDQEKIGENLLNTISWMNRTSRLSH